MEYKAKILRNLEAHGCNWVNYCYTMTGLFDVNTNGALESLIREGRVEKDLINAGTDKFGRQVQAPLYRATPNYGEIVPDNVLSHLTLVK